MHIYIYIYKQERGLITSCYFYVKEYLCPHPSSTNAGSTPHPCLFARDSQACGCGCRTKADKEVETADMGTSSTKMVG